MGTTTHYDVLRVTRNAPPEVIRAAYKALSQTWHPDKNPSAEAANVMRAINVAYAILSDTTQRTQYDRTLQAAETVWAAPQSSRRTAKRSAESNSRQSFEVDWSAVERAQEIQRRKYRALGKDSLLAISKTIGLLFALIYVAHLVAASHG